MKSLTGIQEMRRGPTKVRAQARNILPRLLLYAAQYHNDQNTKMVQQKSMTKMAVSMAMKMTQQGSKIAACMPQSIRMV